MIHPPEPVHTVELFAPDRNALLANVDPPLFDYFASLDPDAFGSPVSRAGPDPAPVWLDVAREYTERWHHQQHIRGAVGKPGQADRRFLHPALAAFVHALPVTLRDVAAPAGTTIQLHLIGDAGGDWSVQREANAWKLFQGAPETPNSRVALDAATAWRLFTKEVNVDQARRVPAIDGDLVLEERLLPTVAIIA